MNRWMNTKVTMPREQRNAEYEAEESQFTLEWECGPVTSACIPKEEEGTWRFFVSKRNIPTHFTTTSSQAFFVRSCRCMMPTFHSLNSLADFGSIMFLLFKVFTIADKTLDGSRSSSRDKDEALPRSGWSIPSTSTTSWNRIFMARCAVILWSELEFEYRMSGLKTQIYTPRSHKQVSKMKQDWRTKNRHTSSPSPCPQWRTNRRALSLSINSNNWAATTTSKEWHSHSGSSHSPSENRLLTDKLVLNSRHPLATMSSTPTRLLQFSQSNSICTSVGEAVVLFVST